MFLCYFWRDCDERSIIGFLFVDAVEFLFGFSQFLADLGGTKNGGFRADHAGAGTVLSVMHVFVCLFLVNAGRF